MTFRYRGNLLPLAFAGMLAMVWLGDATSRGFVRG